MIARRVAETHLSTPAENRLPRGEGQDGFTIVEVLISTAIVMAVTGSIASLMNQAQAVVQAQPEVADLQQRLRVGAERLSRDLAMAGAGVYLGTTGGALRNVLAPVMPYRFGGKKDDPAAGVFYRADTISVVYVPRAPAQTGVAHATPANAPDLDVTPIPACGDVHHQLCAFAQGMQAVVFDGRGNWDAFTVTGVQHESSRIGHAGQPLSTAYPPGAVIAEARFHTYYLKTDPKTNTYALMHFDGDQTDQPVVDNVVKLGFEYVGDAAPPELLPGADVGSVTGPWTTYGPRPPPLGVDVVGDTWGAGENCVFQVVGGRQVPRLATLGDAIGLVTLGPATLQDGPWCGGDSRSARFDADLLRIRRIRVTIRVQAALASLRGPAGPLFMRGGTSWSLQRYVPDQEIRLDVSPRNMSLGR